MTWLWLLLSLPAMAAPEDFFRDLEAFKQSSLTIRTEAQKLEAAATRALSRNLHWTPEVNLSAGKTRQRLQTADVTGSAFAVLQDADYLQGTVNWNLFRGGAGVRAAQAARLAREAQGALVENENLAVENQAAKLLFARLYLREALGAQRELLSLQEEAVRIGRDRYRQGKIPLEEVTKLEVDLAQGRNDLRQAEIDVEENLVGLRALFVEEFRTQEWPFTTKQALNLGEAQSPVLQSLKLQSESAERATQAARGLHWPSLDLTFQYQRYPLSNLENTTWSGALSLTLPLWSRFETQATVAEASARATEAANLAATREKEEALRRDFLRKKISLSAENLEEARRNSERSEGLYRTMLRSFQLGRLSANDLLIEQNRRIGTILKLAQSRRAFHDSLVDACALWGSNARACFR